MSATNYCDITTFKDWAGIPSTTTTHDSKITAVCLATYDAINNHCRRVFSTTSETRVFQASDYYCLELFGNDISIATGVTVSHASANNTTYDVTWASTDFELRPLNGKLNGVSWPYTEIRAVGNQTFPVAFTRSDRAHVQISATWGWPSVPNAVTEAAKEIALDLFKSKDAPFGVAGTTEFGTVRVKSEVAAMAALLLRPYCRNKVMIG